MKTPRQDGIAVISAMLLAALTAMIVGNLIWNQQLLISELENQQDAAQADWLAFAAINWSRAILAEDARNGQIDHAREAWATRLPPTPVEGGEISGFIADEQRLFNVNNLIGDGGASEADAAAFRRLLERLGLKPELADAAVDWLDSDDLTSGPGGAEDTHYLGLAQPYRTANRRLNEMGNLIRVRGFDRAAVDKLGQFATVLPKAAPVNVNTAPAEVLAFVLAGATPQDAQAIVAARNVAFYKDLGDFRLRLPNANIVASDALLAVGSNYFRVTCLSRFGHSHLKYEALISRGNAAWPRVIWMRRG